MSKYDELKKEKFVRVENRFHQWPMGQCVISENALCSDRVWVLDNERHHYEDMAECCICEAPRVPRSGWLVHPSLRPEDGGRRWMCTKCWHDLPVFNPHDPSQFDE
jgi:hypothetical protein